MMATVPAWKKLGLKVKDNNEVTSFNDIVHLDTPTVDKNLAKKLNKKRRQEEEKSRDTKEKKPPKRQKLPKSERKPPPEKDQLAYLRQYSVDKENWKFSKQKQNWILKHLDSIPHEYEDLLIAYIEGIQGGARSRLVEQLTEVANRWNAISEALEAKVNAELYGEGENEAIKEGNEETKGENTPQSVTRENAIRTRKLLHALTGENIELLGLEEEGSESEQRTKESTSTTVVSDVKDDSNQSSEDALDGQSASEEPEKETGNGANDEGEDESEDDGSKRNIYSSKKVEEEDNIIIESVDVEDFFEDSDGESLKKSKSQTKSRRKSTNKKHSRSGSLSKSRNQSDASR